MDARGQAVTLEAITAALLLVAGLVFALQATGVTPLSASTSSQHIENQQQATAEGALTAAIEADALKVAVLNWDGANKKFYGASERYYVHTAPSNKFGDILTRTFEPHGIVYNVYVTYETENGDRKRQRMVYRGEPSDNAVIGSATVTLYDDDPMYDDDERVAIVDGESHTYDGATTYRLDRAPVVRNSTHNVYNASGTNFTRGDDYRVIDDDGDGKLESIKWVGSTPDNSETFYVYYTPSVSDDNYFAPDTASSGVYNVVTVEVVVWRQ